MTRPTLLFILLLAMVWQNASAREVERWGNNTHLLPQYCKDRAKGSQSPEWAKWSGTFGEAFIHMHHYCAGIFAEQKAKSAPNQHERANWLVKVLSQMKYVSGSCNAGCAIYPELHTRWGWALGRQGQTAEAIKHYQLAFQAKKNYAPAYARLSEVYLEINQPDEARKVLEQGLENSPKSSMLKRRLKELDSSR
jgi:tetratricopeptide (TPR) repeat protein